VIRLTLKDMLLMKQLKQEFEQKYKPINIDCIIASINQSYLFNQLDNVVGLADIKISDKNEYHSPKIILFYNNLNNNLHINTLLKGKSLTWEYVIYHEFGHLHLCLSRPELEGYFKPRQYHEEYADQWALKRLRV